MVNEEQLNKIAPKIDKLVKNVGQKLPGLSVGLTNEKETVYFNYSGILNVDSNEPVTKDTVFGLFSLTKAMTAFAILKLHELKKLDIEDEVLKFLPEIDEVYIVDKGTVHKETGEFLKPPRKPKTKVTIRHLLTMTAGFSYPFLNEEYRLLAFKKNSHIHSGNPSIEVFKTDKSPLIAEPGTRFLYGVGMDWTGRIVEEVTGKALGEYLKEILFDPAGMKSCTFHVKDTKNLIRVHRRDKEGKFRSYPRGVVLDPSIDMGGGGCFGTVEDYLKFMRVWLNHGYSPDAGRRLLDEELVKYALENHLPPGLTVKFDIPGFPDSPDGFSFAGMAVTTEVAFTGRPVNTVYWSGLANLYYWVDTENKIGGFWASQVLPMGDPQSFLGYCKLETAVYDVINGEEEDDDEDEEDNQHQSKL